MALLDVLDLELTPQLVTVAAPSQILNLHGCQTLAISISVDVPPADQTFNSGESEITTLTFPTKAGSTGGDYFVVYDTAGNGWAAALNKSGSDPAPTGAIWTALSAGRKVNVDISSATTGAQVEALVETAFDALTSNPFTTVAATADMAVTCTIRGNTTNFGVHSADDGGAGSITGVTTNQGVASDVNVTSNVISISAHGYLTGQEITVTSTGTLPAPLVVATPYYVILVTSGSLKLATTLENAEAGTPIDLTTQGSDGAVVTVDVDQIADGSVKLQKSLGADLEDDYVWFDEGSPVVISADGSIYIEKVDPTGAYYRLYYGLSSGQMTVTGRVLGKGMVS